MIALDSRKETWRATLGIDTLLWVLLVLLLAPVVIAFRSLPWSNGLLVWTIPTLMVSGLALGGLLIAITAPNRWWLALLGAAVCFGGSVEVGSALVTHSSLAVSAGSTLLGAYVCGFSAALPWLVFRAKQAWIAIASIWVSLGGAWKGAFSSQQTWTLVWVLTLSLIFLGIFRLREEMRLWQVQRLERIGPVLWPSARAITALSLLVAIIGIAPLGVARLAALSQFWHKTPLANGGPLAYDSAQGTPEALLGQPLALDAPDVGGNQVILTYQILMGPPTAPPLIGAAFDTFAGTSWSSGPTLGQPATALKAPDGALTMQAKVVVTSAWPDNSNTPLLLGFSEPLTFSVSTRAQVVSGASGALGIAAWQATKPLKPGAAYTTTSAIIADDATGTGTLTPAFTTRMTAVPTQLQAQLRSQAIAWVGDTSAPPATQANALLDAFQKHFTIKPQTIPPTTADPVSWALNQHQGNVLLATTTYILLGRSIGLPLRLAEGYVSHITDISATTIAVHASDATVWAQLALPGLGWRDLFPAANVQKVDVPGSFVYSGVDPTPTPQVSPTPTPLPKKINPNPKRGATQGESGSPLVVILLAVLALMMVMGTLLALIAWRWQQFGRQFEPLARFFVRLKLLAGLAGISVQPSDTATQATIKVANQVPDQATTLFALNDSYERLRYGRPGERGILPQLGEVWRHVSIALWRLVRARPWQRFRKSKTTWL